MVVLEGRWSLFEPEPESMAGHWSPVNCIMTSD